MRSIVITCASTGIGFAAAKLLLQMGFRVFGSVRKAHNVERLPGEIGPEFTLLLFDVTGEPPFRLAANVVRTALA